MKPYMANTIIAWLIIVGVPIIFGGWLLYKYSQIPSDAWMGRAGR
jgi:hypothetical protein